METEVFFLNTPEDRRRGSHSFPENESILGSSFTGASQSELRLVVDNKSDKDLEEFTMVEKEEVTESQETLTIDMTNIVNPFTSLNPIYTFFPSHNFL